MTELEQITSLIESPSFDTLPKSAKKELREKQQALIRKLVKSTLKEHLEPILMQYDLDSDIRIYNDGDEGIQIEFVEFWGDVDNPSTPVKEPEPEPEPEVEEDDVDEPEEIPENPQETEMEEDSDFQAEEIFPHELNWSQFLYGMVVDTEFHENVFKALGTQVKRGEQINVTVLLDGSEYSCRFDNANRQVNGNTIRLMYNRNQDEESLGDCLQSKFPKTFSYIKAQKEILGSRAQIEIPENLQVELKLLTTDVPMTFRMECVVSENYGKDEELDVLSGPYNRFSGEFKKLNRAKIKGKLAPHKPILLLAMIDLVENGKIKDFMFKPSVFSSKKEFDKNWYRLVGSDSGFRKTMATPLWHMNNEPFWKLNLKMDDALTRQILEGKQTPSFGQIEQIVDSIEIEPELFALLKTPKYRAKFRELIVNECFKK